MARNAVQEGLSARFGGVRQSAQHTSFGEEAPVAQPKFQVLGIKPMATYLAQMTDENGKVVTAPVFVVEDKSGNIVPLIDPRGEGWFASLVAPPKKMAEKFLEMLQPKTEAQQAVMNDVAKSALSGDGQ